MIAVSTKVGVTKASFRHRGFVCASCGVTTMVFGNDPAPLVCPSCGSANPPAVEWDHQVSVTTEVSPNGQPASGAV